MSDIQIVITLFSGIASLLTGYFALSKQQTRRLNRLSNDLFAALKEDVRVANERAAGAETKNARHEVQLENLQTSLHTAETRLTLLDALQAQVKVLTDSLGSVQRRVVELEIKNEELDKALTSTSEEKHRLEKEIESKDKQIGSLEAQAATLQKVFSWMGVEYSKMESKIVPMEQPA